MSYFQQYKLKYFLQLPAAKRSLTSERLKHSNMKNLTQNNMNFHIFSLLVVVFLLLTEFCDSLIIESDKTPLYIEKQSVLRKQPTLDSTIWINDTSTFSSASRVTGQQDSTSAINYYSQNHKLAKNSRFLLECQIDNCLYCIIVNQTELCIVCSYPYLPDLAKTQCSQIDTNGTGPIITSCTIENCLACQIMTLGIIKQQVCTQCSIGYRFLIIQAKCYPMKQLKDSEEIISYGDYYYLCQEGCKKCEPSTTIELCFQCSIGYTMIQNAYTCIKCKGSCQSCLYNDTSVCTSCLPGYVLNGSQCLKCRYPVCKTCQIDDLSYCTECMNQYYESFGYCYKCFYGFYKCNNCPSSAQCFQKCSMGEYSYYQFKDNSYQHHCVQCRYGCFQCNGSSYCTKCFPGYYLQNLQDGLSQCKNCKQNCWECTSSENCQKCLIGFDLFNNNCIKQKQNCILMNHDGNCKVCKSRYQLSAKGECIFNIDSFDTSIVTVACKYGMFAQNYWCYYCADTFPNCYQCNSAYCLKCNEGYYYDADNYSCVQNQYDGCKLFQSQLICLECEDGFYLNYLVTGNQTKSMGSCLYCDSNCKTCYQKSYYCVTCYDGYTLNSQRSCKNILKYEINLTLDFQYQYSPNKLTDIKNYLQSLIIGYNSTIPYPQIVFLQIYSGSTIIQAQVHEQNSESLQKNFQILKSALSIGSQIGGVNLINVEFSKVQPLPPTPPTPESQVNILAIILGSVFGFLALVIIALVIYFCCCRNKKNKEDYQKKSSSLGQTVDEYIQEQKKVEAKKENEKEKSDKDSKKEENHESEKEIKLGQELMESQARLGESQEQKKNPKLFNPYKYI